ncbi:MAG: RNA polymerase sigma factor [Vicinamibacterales bacterium]
MVEHGRPPDRATTSGAGGAQQVAPAAQDQGPASAESTVTLLDRYRQGDTEALNTLYARYLGPLRRWARGRLPQWARDVGDTEDLVQDTLIQALRRMDTFEPRGAGALGGYLRQAILNRIVDRVRRRRPPVIAEPTNEVVAIDPSPLEELIGKQMLDRYEVALQQLRPDEREAVVGRLEFGMSYLDLASALGKSSPDAARMAVSRALLKVAGEMRDD